MTEQDVLAAIGEGWRPLREVQDELADRFYDGDWKQVSSEMKNMRRAGVIRYKRTGNRYSVRASVGAKKKAADRACGVEEMIVVRALLHEIDRLLGDQAKKVVWDYFYGGRGKHDKLKAGE